MAQLVAILAGMENRMEANTKGMENNMNKKMQGLNNEINGMNEKMEINTRETRGGQ